MPEVREPLFSEQLHVMVPTGTLAAVRAATAQTTIQKSVSAAGTPPAASQAPCKAKGRAKIEWLNFTIEK